MPVKMRNAPKTKTSQLKAENRAMPTTTKITRNTSAPITPHNSTW
jgi:hypothetical protein